MVINGNHNKCLCECKELNDWGFCKNDFMWNLNKCDCNKSSEIDEFLEIKTCSCEKYLIGKLILKCED